MKSKQCAFPDCKEKVEIEPDNQCEDCGKYFCDANTHMIEVVHDSDSYYSCHKCACEALYPASEVR